MHITLKQHLLALKFVKLSLVDEVDSIAKGGKGDRELTIVVVNLGSNTSVEHRKLAVGNLRYADIVEYANKLRGRIGGIPCVALYTPGAFDGTHWHQRNSLTYRKDATAGGLPP